MTSSSGLHQAGTTILLVEQNAQMALSVADRGYVLETGRVVSTGTGAACSRMRASRRPIWAAENVMGPNRN